MIGHRAGSAKGEGSGIRGSSTVGSLSWRRACARKSSRLPYREISASNRKAWAVLVALAVNVARILWCRRGPAHSEHVDCSPLAVLRPGVRSPRGPCSERPSTSYTQSPVSQGKPRGLAQNVRELDASTLKLPPVRFRIAIEVRVTDRHHSPGWGLIPSEPQLAHLGSREQLSRCVSPNIEPSTL